MDFNIKKPKHILALILVIFTFIVFIIIPVLSYIGVPLTSGSNPIGDLPEPFSFLFSVIILILQLALVIVLFIIVPIIWYRIVNNFDKKQILLNLNLKKKGIDEAILWGIITTIFAFAIIIILGIILMFFGFNVEESSNIPTLETYFPLPFLLILITLQPIGEEIFFRGFLFDKITKLGGSNLAIISTAFLFGIAHLSIGNIYPAVMTMVVGIVLGFLIVKTKNLFSAIIAHILFNLVSFGFYILGRVILV
jgi:membrane protease YdiL (CAAX protease family)